MQVLAFLNLKEGVTPDKINPLMSEEVKHTLEAYLDGNIRSFWFRGDSPGVVFMLESANKDEASQVMNELPLVVAGVADFKLIPLQPLKPLGTLIGRKMQP